MESEITRVDCILQIHFIPNYVPFRLKILALLRHFVGVMYLSNLDKHLVGGIVFYKRISSSFLFC